MSQTWEKLQVSYFHGRLEQIELWKINGDELIFSVEIKHPNEVSMAIGCWLTAFVELRHALRESEGNLEIKSTVWMAGFPVNNTEVAMINYGLADEGRLPLIDFDDPETASHYLIQKWHERPEFRRFIIKDFIGRSIDLGFRLSACTTPRFMTIYVDVAYALASGQWPTDLGKCPFNEQSPLLLLDEREIKGIGNSPYPIFGIDYPNTRDKHVDKYRRAMSSCVGAKPIIKSDVEEICEHYYLSNMHGSQRPFIIGCDHPKFNSIPNGYNEKINSLVNAIENQIKKETTRLAIQRFSSNDAVEEKLLASPSSLDKKK